MKRTIAMLTAVSLLAGGAISGISGISAWAGAEGEEQIIGTTLALETAWTLQYSQEGEQSKSASDAEEDTAAIASESEMAAGESAEATQTESPESADSGSAWYWNGEVRQYGSLEALLFAADGTIYIASDQVFAVSGDAAAEDADLAPDPTVFADGAYVVFLSQTNPEGDTAGDTRYIWVGLDGDDADSSEMEAELLVRPTNYSAATWTNAVPSFALSAVPNALTGYGFAVSVDGGVWNAIDDAYTPATEGVHTYDFALTDSAGNRVCESARYTVWLDTAAPKVKSVKLSRSSGKLTVSATDAMSGVSGISLDGGETWLALEADEDGSATYREAYSGSSVAAGLLLVSDEAGNLWTSTKTYAKRSLSSKKSSSSSSKSKGSKVTLSLGGGEMTQLTIGGEALDLTLWLDPGNGETSASFNAAFAVWNAAEGDEDWDTLLLSASNADEALAQPYVYHWAFSGAVCKTLSNSGIRYLALQVGERVTAISTAGFIAGEQYDALKSAGISSKAFDYSVSMGMPGPELQMAVSVEKTDYALTGDSAQEMYHYDVYTGSPEMMNAAWGAW